jgi:hypothetical protein
MTHLPLARTILLVDDDEADAFLVTEAFWTSPPSRRQSEPGLPRAWHSWLQSAPVRLDTV